ncbi:MAG: hypothetical protein LGR52_15185 [Candidatus Thiosymbion ectosymbiont of Robbea hypermnestra]|nr:hypothetical protein [Candidatus Thiosymbion ectosymbiont of Robbea hypermnestra]
MSNKTPIDEGPNQLKTFDFPNWLKFTIQYVVMPLAMLMAGYYLSGRVQQKQIESQDEIKKIEIASNLTKELFDLRPIEVLTRVKIIMRIVDKDTGDTIKKAVVQHYKNVLTMDERGELKFSEKKKQVVTDIQVAMGSSSNEVASEIKKQIGSDKYYLIVASLLDKSAAIEKAQTLRAIGYDAEVHYSVTGYYGVTIAKTDIFTARQVFERARAEGHAPVDAYLHNGSRFEQKVFPRF